MGVPRVQQCAHNEQGTAPLSEHHVDSLYKKDIIACDEQEIGMSSRNGTYVDIVFL
jgi:hypothetical protein